MYRSSLSLYHRNETGKSRNRTFLFRSYLHEFNLALKRIKVHISILEMSSSTEEEPNECKHYQAPCPERIAFFQVEVLVGLMRVLLGN